MIFNVLQQIITVKKHDVRVLVRIPLSTAHSIRILIKTDNGLPFEEGFPFEEGLLEHTSSVT